MADRLAEFAEKCREALVQKPGPPGREAVVKLLEELLQDGEFVATYIDGETNARKVLYEDPELGFCVLAHSYEGASVSQPHDHGSSWAIYGQARGETEMTEWEKVEAPSGDTPGKVKPARTYVLKPGMACLYNEGQLHSPRREDSTRLVRIEGRNMDGVKRDRYEAIA